MITRTRNWSRKKYLALRYVLLESFGSLPAVSSTQHELHTHSIQIITPHDAAASIETTHTTIVTEVHPPHTCNSSKAPPLPSLPFSPPPLRLSLICWHKILHSKRYAGCLQEAFSVRFQLDLARVRAGDGESSLPPPAPTHLLKSMLSGGR